MKQNLYVTAGHSINSERYDLNKNRWSECNHTLLYSLSAASVVVSRDETFAVVTGDEVCSLREKELYNNRDKMIIFTEQNEFYVYD